jgi:hypothetical protein
LYEGSTPQRSSITTAAAVASDPIAELEQKITGGQTKLEFEKDHGYLVSLLKVLKVRSRRKRGFSRRAASERISPKTPRAIYFNDDAHVAWVRG